MNGRESERSCMKFPRTEIKTHLGCSTGDTSSCSREWASKPILQWVKDVGVVTHD